MLESIFGYLLSVHTYRSHDWQLIEDNYMNTHVGCGMGSGHSGLEPVYHHPESQSGCDKCQLSPGGEVLPKYSKGSLLVSVCFSGPPLFQSSCLPCHSSQTKRFPFTLCFPPSFLVWTSPSWVLAGCGAEVRGKLVQQMVLSCWSFRKIMVTVVEGHSR